MILGSLKKVEKRSPKELKPWSEDTRRTSGNTTRNDPFPPFLIIEAQTQLRRGEEREEEDVVECGGGGEKGEGGKKGGEGVIGKRMWRGGEGRREEEERGKDERWALAGVKSETYELNVKLRLPLDPRVCGLYIYFSLTINKSTGDEKKRKEGAHVPCRYSKFTRLLQVPWSNEHPLENKELNAVIGAWFTLWRD
ncbi:hypothetical protein Tco_0625519 [Tanacetum coccineum]|uniref:Uncharacterized protein n=1 Tax=Tanacetum coccineum TaxID=301880 RepID=A0ABQ4WGZ8_9ASTR